MLILHGFLNIRNYIYNLIYKITSKEKMHIPKKLKSSEKLAKTIVVYVFGNIVIL